MHSDWNLVIHQTSHTSGDSMPACWASFIVILQKSETLFSLQRNAEADLPGGSTSAA